MDCVVRLLKFGVVGLMACRVVSCARCLGGLEGVRGAPFSVVRRRGLNGSATDTFRTFSRSPLKVLTLFLICPHHAPSSRNPQQRLPGRSILHYSLSDRLCQSWRNRDLAKPENLCYNLYQTEVLGGETMAVRWGMRTFVFRSAIEGTCSPMPPG